MLPGYSKATRPVLPLTFKEKVNSAPKVESYQCIYCGFASDDKYEVMYRCHCKVAQRLEQIQAGKDPKSKKHAKHRRVVGKRSASVSAAYHYPKKVGFKPNE